MGGGIRIGLRGSIPNAAVCRVRGAAKVVVGESSNRGVVSDQARRPLRQPPLPAPLVAGRELVGAGAGDRCAWPGRGDLAARQRQGLCPRRRGHAGQSSLRHRRPALWLPVVRRLLAGADLGAPQRRAAVPGDLAGGGGGGGGRPPPPPPAPPAGPPPRPAPP